MVLVQGAVSQCRGGRGKVAAILPVAVIDSLNMLSMNPLEREEVFRLFGLFRQYQTTGVFVVEASQGVPFDSTMADVVIRLSATEDNDYFTRHIEIEKLCYRNQVYGRHPFRTVRMEAGEVTPPVCDKHDGSDLPPLDPPAPWRGGAAVVALRGAAVGGDAAGRPELGKDQKKGIGGSLAKPRTNVGDRGDEPDPAAQPGCREHDCGGRSARNVQDQFNPELSGARLREGEHVLLIRLHDRGCFPPRQSRPPTTNGRREQGDPVEEAAGSDATVRLARVPAHRRRRTIGKGRLSMAKSGERKEGGNYCLAAEQITGREVPSLFEIDFKSGALLPEEVMQVLWDLMIRQPAGQPLQRAVLMDVREIGPAYPLLRKNTTSGDMFLPALAHIMCDNRIDFVVAGTTGELAEADEAVGRICAVADGVVSCRHLDVFGKRLVILQGEGLIATSQRAAKEKDVEKDADSYMCRRWCDT